MRDINLVVQSDDFGMCHAGNEGVVRAFEEGILTQASVMVPCPWFAEAAALAREHSIPVGVHLTLTSEWDRLRWGPLTGARSLVGDDGRFPRTIAEAQEKADPDEVVEEFVAQIECFRAAGLEPGYFDCHMGIVFANAYAEVSRRYRKPFLYPIFDGAFTFDSIHMMSGRPSGDKLAYLLDRFGALGPGVHLFVSHCAEESPELRALTSPRDDNSPWANEYRVSDLTTLTSPEVREFVDARGIRLASVAELV